VRPALSSLTNPLVDDIPEIESLPPISSEGESRMFDFLYLCGVQCVEVAIFTCTVVSIMYATLYCTFQEVKS